MSWKGTKHYYHTYPTAPQKAKFAKGTYEMCKKTEVVHIAGPVRTKDVMADDYSIEVALDRKNR